MTCPGGSTSSADPLLPDPYQGPLSLETWWPSPMQTWALGLPLLSMADGTCGLIPGWQKLDGERDIGWAEAIGFELLIRSIIQSDPNTNTGYAQLYNDNQRVVDG